MPQVRQEEFGLFESSFEKPQGSGVIVAEKLSHVSHIALKQQKIYITNSNTQNRIQKKLQINWGKYSFTISVKERPESCPWLQQLVLFESFCQPGASHQAFSQSPVPLSQHSSKQQLHPPETLPSAVLGDCQHIAYI